MNERIRELIRKTSFIDTELLTEPQTVMLEKFSELIIKECADIALKSGNVANKSIEAVAEANRIYHKIQDHFGD